MEKRYVVGIVTVVCIVLFVRASFHAKDLSQTPTFQREISVSSTKLVPSFSGALPIARKLVKRSCRDSVEDRNCYPEELDEIKKQALADPKDTAEELNKLRFRYPQNVEILKELGALYQSKGDTEKALNTFQTALTLNPARIDIASRMQSLYFSSHREKEGEAFFNLLEKNTDEDPFALNYSADYAFHSGKYDVAIERLEKSISKMPDLLSSYDLLADAYLRTQNTKQAKRILSQLLEFHLTEKQKVERLGYSTAGIDKDIQNTQGRIDELKPVE